MALRVLVADDDASIRTLLREVLEEDGFTVDEAEDGGDALARIRGARPDVLLLDLNMPHVTGWDVFAQLKSLPHAPPVVLMSGMQWAQFEMDRLGAAAGLIKPFSVDEVLTTVERLAARAGSGVPG